MLYLAIFFSLFIYIVYRELEGSLDNCLVRNFVKRILPSIEYYRANLSSKRMKRKKFLTYYQRNHTFHECLSLTRRPTSSNVEMLNMDKGEIGLILYWRPR